MFVQRSLASRPLAVALGVALGLAGLFAAGSTAAQEAGAQEADEDRSAEEADALIRQGVDMRREGRDEEGLLLLRRAYELHPSPRALAQIAIAEQALGRWVEAETYLDRALTHGDDPWVRERATLLSQSLATIRAHLTDLVLAGGPEGALVLVNGEERGRLPIEGPLRVGFGDAPRVRLEVRLAGFQAYTREVEVEPNATTRVEITMTRQVGGEAGSEAGGEAGSETGGEAGGGSGGTPHGREGFGNQGYLGGEINPLLWAATALTVVGFGVGIGVGAYALGVRSDVGYYSDESAIPAGVADGGFGLALLAGVTAIALAVDASLGDRPSEQTEAATAGGIDVGVDLALDLRPGRSEGQARLRIRF